MSRSASGRVTTDERVQVHPELTASPHSNHVLRPRQTPQENDLGRHAFGGDQCGISTGKKQPSWAPEHIASVMGAAVIGSSKVGDLLTDGG